MEERPTEYREDEIDLGIYFAILRKAWWKIALFSVDLISSGSGTKEDGIPPPDYRPASAPVPAF